MIKTLCFSLLAISAWAQNPVTPGYPGAVATDTDLLVAKDSAASTLSGAINNSTLSVGVADSSKFLAGSACSIDSELVKICTVGSGTLTLCAGTRGFQSTLATSHSSGAPIRCTVNAAYHNSVAAHIKAIETALGADLGNVNAYQSFSSSGTYNVPAGMTRVFVQVWAGGGGATYTEFGVNSIGGGGGGYVEGWCPVTGGGTVSVTVGAGGSAGTSSVAAGIGGTSSFGSCLSAVGGGGGTNALAWLPGRDNAMPAWDATALAMTGCTGCYSSRPDSGGAGASAVTIPSAGGDGGFATSGGGGGGSGAAALGGVHAAGAGGASGRGGVGGTGGRLAGGPVLGCTPGLTPGGGGGGPAWDGATTRNGCAGGAGEVRVWR